MDGFVTLLVLAAVIGAAILWTKFTSAASRGITRAVAHGKHVRGQEAVHRQLDFTVPGTADAFLGLIKQRLEVVPSPPAINHDLYLDQESDDFLIYAVGSKIFTSLHYLISVDNEDDHATGTATVLDWTENDGLVTTIDHIERLERHVTAAVEAMGGTISSHARA